MTEVAFHFNVPQFTPYAVRLLRKAHQARAKVTVVAPAEELAQLDALLWTYAPAEFLPHCNWDAPEHVLTRSPILLATPEGLSGSCHHEVLLHWGTQAPPQGFESFSRLIELVSQDEADRQTARQRWKHYADRGYPITRYDAGVAQRQ
jgi:DNA polymerase-3 subunit chi